MRATARAILLLPPMYFLSFFACYAAAVKAEPGITFPPIQFSAFNAFYRRPDGAVVFCGTTETGGQVAEWEPLTNQIHKLTGSCAIAQGTAVHVEPNLVGFSRRATDRSLPENIEENAKLGLVDHYPPRCAPVFPASFKFSYAHDEYEFYALGVLRRPHKVQLSRTCDAESENTESITPRIDEYNIPLYVPLSDGSIVTWSFDDRFKSPFVARISRHFRDYIGCSGNCFLVLASAVRADLTKAGGSNHMRLETFEKAIDEITGSVAPTLK